jgi:hypothetical protein
MRRCAVLAILMCTYAHSGCNAQGRAYLNWALLLENEFMERP